LFEYDFNRKVVQRIYDGLLHYNLKKYCIEPIILVPELQDISIATRLKREHAIYEQDPEIIGLSIHGNAFRGIPSKANGWEAWTSIGWTESDLIAEYIYIEAEKRLPFRARKDTRDCDSDKESRFAMVHKTKGNWVLTENGFMDNEKDCQYMMSDKGIIEIADVHVMALIKYITANRMR
jgi:N-acetylmuramoyl-L-alanine amidase